MSLFKDYSSGGKFLSNDSSRRKFTNDLAGILKKSGKGGGDSRGRAGELTEYLKETSGGKGLDANSFRKAIEESDFSSSQKKDLLDIITNEEDAKNN